MNLEDLEPQHQRILFNTAELIREEPRRAQEWLLQIWSLGVAYGKRLGVTEALEAVRETKGGPA